MSGLHLVVLADTDWGIVTGLGQLLAVLCALGLAFVFRRAMPRGPSDSLAALFGGRALHPPEWLLEAAGKELGPSFRIFGESRLETTLDGGRAATIQLDSRKPRQTYTATLSVQLRAAPLPPGAIATRFRLDAADQDEPWPAGLQPAPGRWGAARLGVEMLARNLGAIELRVEGDRLVAEVVRRAEQWDDWAKALRQLEVIAAAIEPPPPAPPSSNVHVDVHAQESTHLRCAYCHEDFAESEAAPGAASPSSATAERGDPDRAVVRCERCGTVLHAGCRAELGRCPALGCGGGESERPRRGVT